MKQLVLLLMFLTLFVSSVFAQMGTGTLGDGTPIGDVPARPCLEGYQCMKAEECNPEKYMRLENVSCNDKQICCKLKEDKSGEDSKK